MMQPPSRQRHPMLLIQTIQAQIHHQVVAVVQTPDEDKAIVRTDKELVLVLDDIRDPGNMGTILRIADWFGIDWVFLSEGCVEVHNPKVVQSSMGAFLRVNTMKSTLKDLLKKTGEIPVMGTKLNGQSVFEMDIPQAAIVVVGNESKGISNANDSFLTHSISIPRDPSGGAESLNAAVATGIICARLKNH